MSTGALFHDEMSKTTGVGTVLIKKSQQIKFEMKIEIDMRMLSNNHLAHI